METYITLQNLDRMPPGLRPLQGTKPGNYGHAQHNPSTGLHEIRMPLARWVEINADVVKQSHRMYGKWAIVRVEEHATAREAELADLLDKANSEIARLTLSGRSNATQGEPAGGLDFVPHETKTAPETPAPKVPGFRELRTIAIRHKMPGYADITKKADMLALVQKHAPEELAGVPA